MTDMNSASNDLRLDLVIDRIVAGRLAGSAVADQAAASPGADDALIAELSQLGEIDWPADEVGDRIAKNVAAAADPHIAGRNLLAAHATAGRGQHPGAGHMRPGRSRWIAVAAAAIVALAVGVIWQATGGPPARHLAGRTAAGHKPSTRPTAPAAKQHDGTGSWLTAMRVVGQGSSLRAVGAADINNESLTCVSSSVCYVTGPKGASGYAIARSVNGGVTWTAGQPLPALSSQFDFEVEISCPLPLTCFLPYGNELLKTTDGFAHYQVLPVTLASSADLSLVSCPTTRHCVATIMLADGSPAFIYSDDGGNSWTRASSPPGSADGLIYALRCDPDGACIAAVSMGDETNPLVAALSSTDGGRSWSMSGRYSTVSEEQGFVSCGDGRNCLYITNDGYLAWMHAAPDGHISIRVQAFPKSWGTDGIDVSCATGLDCFVETGGSNVVGYNEPTLEATRDGGVTWTSTPLAPELPQDTAVYLNCPVPAGCIALADDGTGNQSSYAVLSNLHNPA